MSRLMELIHAPNAEVGTWAVGKAFVSASGAPALVESAHVAARHALRVFGLPFDMAREIYARGVQTGLVPNSMLAWRDVEVALDAMEKVTLGPLARRV